MGILSSLYEIALTNFNVILIIIFKKLENESGAARCREKSSNTRLIRRFISLRGPCFKGIMGDTASGTATPRTESSNPEGRHDRGGGGGETPQGGHLPKRTMDSTLAARDKAIIGGLPSNGHFPLWRPSHFDSSDEW